MSWLTRNLGGLAATIGGGALTAVGGGALGVPLMLGGIGAIGQDEANSTNRQIAADATAANINSAREQMAFQERMSNTAMQRGKLDMSAAGINPLLAGANPDSSPSGAMGKAETTTVSSMIGQGVNSAIAAKQLMADLQAKGSQTALNNALASKSIVDAQLSAANTRSSTIGAAALESQLAAIRARAKADEATAGYDLRASKFDAINNRLNKASNTASNVGRLFNLPNFFSKQPNGTTLMKNSTGEVLNEVP